MACVAGLASASVASSAALALAGASTTTSAAIDAISYETASCDCSGLSCHSKSEVFKLDIYITIIPQDYERINLKPMMEIYDMMSAILKMVYAMSSLQH